MTALKSQNVIDDHDLICALRVDDQTSIALDLITQKQWIPMAHSLIHPNQINAGRPLAYSPLEFLGNFSLGMPEKIQRNKDILAALKKSGYDPNQDPNSASAMRAYLMFRGFKSDKSDPDATFLEPVLDAFSQTFDPKTSAPWAWTLFNNPHIGALWSEAFVDMKQTFNQSHAGQSLLGWIWQQARDAMGKWDSEEFANLIVTTDVLTNAGVCWGSVDDPSSFLSQAAPVLLKKNWFTKHATPCQQDLADRIKSEAARQKIQSALDANPKTFVKKKKALKM